VQSAQEHYKAVENAALLESGHWRILHEGAITSDLNDQRRDSERQAQRECLQDTCCIETPTEGVDVLVRVLTVASWRG
jgi:hypothetical protein